MGWEAALPHENVRDSTLDKTDAFGMSENTSSDILSCDQKRERGNTFFLIVVDKKNSLCLSHSVSKLYILIC